MITLSKLYTPSDGDTENSGLENKIF